MKSNKHSALYTDLNNIVTRVNGLMISLRSFHDLICYRVRTEKMKTAGVDIMDALAIVL